MKIYLVKFYVKGDKESHETEVDLPNIRGLIEKFWQWIRSTTFFEESDVTIWSIAIKREIDNGT